MATRPWRTQAFQRNLSPEPTWVFSSVVRRPTIVLTRSETLIKPLFSTRQELINRSKLLGSLTTLISEDPLSLSTRHALLGYTHCTRQYRVSARESRTLLWLQDVVSTSNRMTVFPCQCSGTLGYAQLVHVDADRFYRLFSDHGKTYSFDDRATSGFARGDGVGCIILKPLKQAMLDNDRIRAVIVGTGTNQDGRTPGK